MKPSTGLPSVGITSVYLPALSVIAVTTGVDVSVFEYAATIRSLTIVVPDRLRSLATPDTVIVAGTVGPSIIVIIIFESLPHAAINNMAGASFIPRRYDQSSAVCTTYPRAVPTSAPAAIVSGVVFTSAAATPPATAPATIVVVALGLALGAAATSTCVLTVTC